MRVITKKHSFKTTADGSITDLTSTIDKALKNVKMQNGTVTIFCIGSTCSISTIEYEEGLLDDFCSAMARFAPKNITYVHHEKWHDGNGRSHVKATLVGPSLTVPVVEGELCLGTWQQIVFMEWDTRGRQREVVLQFYGE